MPKAIQKAPQAKPHLSLHTNDANDFLAKYKQAWETRNADLVASLFTRDAQYTSGPFGEPILGREAIHDHWNSATKGQEDIRFAVSNSFHSGFILVAEWACTYRDRASTKRKELAGVFLADFYGSQVRVFREYSLSRAI